MRGFLRKRLACLLCVALIAGWLPADFAKADGASTQRIYIVGSITGDNAIQLRADVDKWDGLNGGDLDFAWYAGSTANIEDMDLLNETSCFVLKAEATSLPSSGYIMVQMKRNNEVVAASSPKQFSDGSMGVDFLEGVEAHNVSAPGKKDGSITGTTQRMECQNYTCGSDIKDLAEGEYIVGYNDAARAGTIFSKGFYATYTIGADDATESPNVTTEPTEVPGNTTEPTKVPDQTLKPTQVPGNTTEPTKVPDNTTKPTKVPGSTTEPTKAPGSTTDPTKMPGNTTEPTKAPGNSAKPTSPTEVPGQTGEPTNAPSGSSDPSSANLANPGITVTVANVVYVSNGSGSVSYSGIKTDKKTVSVPDKVTIGGKSYPVTAISAGAFSRSKVQNVKLGKNVKVIGKKAFKNCKSLKKVTFSSKTTTVGAEAFSGCAKLGSVSLPASVKTVGAKAFKNCKKLKTFKLGKKPAKTKKGKVMFGAVGGKKVAIGASALENCLNLRSVIINSQVTKIGNNTFKNCKKLASMLVKSLKLKTVGNRALKGVNHCKISVPTIRLKKYRTLFTNKGQGKKVVIAKV